MSNKLRAILKRFDADRTTSATPEGDSELEAAIKAYILDEIIGEDEPRIKELDRKPTRRTWYTPRNQLRAEQRKKLDGV